MRLVITADPYLPVPPRYYGGIERAIALLVDGLMARGHHVTLIAHPASRVGTRRVAYGIPPHSGGAVRARELAQLSSLVWAHRKRADLIHSFGRLAALAPILPIRSLPKVQSYQRPIPWRGVSRARLVAGDSLLIAACSSALYSDGKAADRARCRTVYNAVDTRLYTAVPSVPDDAPLVFLGRLEAIKGVHHAIAIARQAGRRLVIAGNRVDTPAGTEYFDREIKPYLDRGRVVYVGEVDDVQKDELLGRAAALLMPIEWDEPFGIVMIEALACGTPVIGFRRGAVPEVVQSGVTGFICQTPADAVRAVADLPTLSRARCREEAERRFSPTALVDAYEQLYAEVAA
jgi:glycosyltransferase involved in cell wall biosynthesis